MKIGFIGAGNMASSIIKGIVSNQFIEGNNIYITTTQLKKTQKIAQELHVTPATNNQELVVLSDVIILAVKPNNVKEILLEISPVLENTSKLIVSIAAGLSLHTLQDAIHTEKEEAIIRAMPNMNVAINEGVTAICGNALTTDEQVQTISSLFNAVGSSYVLEEKDFRNFTALAGCSPAFAYLFIDAMSRAGVKNGLSKELSTKIAAETVLGSAKMILTAQNETPWDLIDKVCSPGGTTIAGLIALEDEKFISTVIKGLDATIQRDKELEK